MSKFLDDIHARARVGRSPAPAAKSSEGSLQAGMPPVVGSTVVSAASQAVASLSSSMLPIQQVIQNNPTMMDIPNQWVQAFMGPGLPMTPFGSGASLFDAMAEHEPRSFEYTPNVNSTISPRLAYGLMAFSQLKYYGENIPELAMCRRLLTEELKNFIPQIVDDNGKVVQKARFKLKVDSRGRYQRDRWGRVEKTFTNSNELEVPELAWMTTRPDRFQAFHQWLTRFLYNTIVYDAPAFYRIRDDDNKVIGMRVINGSTLFAVIDVRGEQPEPPAPAFTQIILGQPRQFYNTRQIWYRPRTLRPDAPYGLTATEDGYKAVNLLDNMWQWETAMYEEGTMPEAFLKAPSTWSPDDVVKWETAYNRRMSGNTRERRRLRVIPNGFELLQPKSLVFEHEVYQLALEKVALLSGVHPSELGKAPGGGLGGKGYQEKGEDAHFRMGQGPLKGFIEDAFNDVLSENGYYGYTWQLGSLDVDADPSEEETKWLARFTSGAITRDDYLSGVGLPTIGGSQGAVYLMPAGKTTTTGADPSASSGSDHADASAVGGAVPEGNTSSSAPSSSSSGSSSSSSGSSSTSRTTQDHSYPPGSTDTPSTAIHGSSSGSSSSSSKLAKENTGAMVAFALPPEAERQLLAALPTLPPDATPTVSGDFHITLVYLGEAAGQADKREAICACLQSFGLTHAPLSGVVNGGGVFMPEDPAEPRPVYANFDAPDLPEFHADLVAALKAAGVEFPETHGFTAHITLAYVPAAHAIRVGDLPRIPLTFTSLLFSFADEDLLIPLSAQKRVWSNAHLSDVTEFEKLWHVAEVLKHCGVCADDDDYFGAPVSRETTVLFPFQGANDTEIVGIRPNKKGEDARPALWKPQGGEDDSLVEAIGGPMYVREEAAYLLDRALGLFLVPLSYVTEVDGEKGAVIMYVRGNQPASDVIGQYNPVWIERAALLDAVAGQVDRGGHNWVTHPDDPKRPILIDNGLSFPTGDILVRSAFVEAQRGTNFSSDAIHAAAQVYKSVVWSDIKNLVGDEAAHKARERLRFIIENEKL